MTRPSLNRSRPAAFAQLAALIAIALLGATLSRVTPAAEPLRIEAQAGVCKQGLREDGIWWNSTYPVDNDMRSSCWQLGVSQVPWHRWNTGFGWRLAWVELGRFHANNLVPAWDDQSFSGISGKDCDVETRRGCVYRAKINGRTRGVSFGGLAERQIEGWTLGVETGLYLYNSNFKVSLTNSDPEKPLPPMSMTWGDPIVTPYLGMTIRRGIFLATVRGYGNVTAHERATDCIACSGINHGPAWQATIGFQVPLK